MKNLIEIITGKATSPSTLNVYILKMDSNIERSHPAVCAGTYRHLQIPALGRVHRKDSQNSRGQDSAVCAAGEDTG